MKIYEEDLFEVTYFCRSHLAFQLSNGDFVIPFYEDKSPIADGDKGKLRWVPREKIKINEYYRCMVKTKERIGDTGMFHDKERNPKRFFEKCCMIAKYSHNFGKTRVYRAYDASTVCGRKGDKIGEYFTEGELGFYESFPQPLTSNRMVIWENGMAYEDPNFRSNKERSKPYNFI